MKILDLSKSGSKVTPILLATASGIIASLRVPKRAEAAVDCGLDQD